MCAKFHAFIVKGTIHSLICWTIILQLNLGHYLFTRVVSVTLSFQPQERMLLTREKVEKSEAGRPL